MCTFFFHSENKRVNRVDDAVVIELSRFLFFYTFFSLCLSFHSRSALTYVRNVQFSRFKCIQIFCANIWNESFFFMFCVRVVDSSSSSSSTRDNKMEFGEKFLLLCVCEFRGFVPASSLSYFDKYHVPPSLYPINCF